MPYDKDFNIAKRFFPGITKEQIQKWRRNLVILVQTEVILRQLRNKGTEIVMWTQLLIDIQIAHAFIKVGSLRAVRELIDYYINGIEPYFDWINLRTSDFWVEEYDKIRKYVETELCA